MCVNVHFSSSAKVRATLVCISNLRVMACIFAHLDCRGWRSELFLRQNCPQLTAWQFVGSNLLQNSVAGPENHTKGKDYSAISLTVIAVTPSWLCGQHLLWRFNTLETTEFQLHYACVLSRKCGTIIALCNIYDSRLLQLAWISLRHQHLWCYFCCFNAWFHVDMLCVHCNSWAV